MKTTSNRVKLCRGAECVKNRFFICYFPVIFTYVWWVSHVYLFYAVFFTPRLANGTINYSDWITLVCYPSYGIVSMLCLVSLTRCVFTPPGVVDYGFDEMITETGHKTFCDYCELARPRRAHHCKYCGVCVRKYDHHCPWINNCVGEDNMWLFVLLSFYASWQTAITLCINLYYFYYKLYAVEVDATADRGDSAMDPFFIRHEFWVFVIDLPLTGVFFVLMTSSFLMNVIFVRSDTTKFQSVVDPLYADNFKTIKLTPCVPAMTHLFGTRRVLKWLLMPLGRHRVVPKLIYEYPKGREPNVL